MSPTVTVRSAVLSDLAQMLGLFAQLDAPGALPPDPKAAQSAWAGLLALEGANVFVAELDDKLVSTCTLIIIPNLTHGARPHALIENVVTLESHRGQGLGRKVLHAATEACWSAGCYKVVLSTGSKREAVLGFYEGAGFERGARTAFQMRRE